MKEMQLKIKWVIVDKVNIVPGLYDTIHQVEQTVQAKSKFCITMLDIHDHECNITCKVNKMSTFHNFISKTISIVNDKYDNKIKISKIMFFKNYK